jgi:hypothetical protein
MLNVEKKNLAAVIAVLPALKNPTVSALSDGDWLAVNTILEELTVRRIIPRLKEAGAQGNRRVSAEQDRDVMIKIVDRNGARAMTAQRVRSLSHAEDEVAPILADVRDAGDAALLEYARKFDNSRRERAHPVSGRLSPSFAKQWRQPLRTFAITRARSFPANT